MIAGAHEVIRSTRTGQVEHYLRDCAGAVGAVDICFVGVVHLCVEEPTHLSDLQDSNRHPDRHHDHSRVGGIACRHGRRRPSVLRRLYRLLRLGRDEETALAVRQPQELGHVRRLPIAFDRRRSQRQLHLAPIVVGRRSTQNRILQHFSPIHLI